MRKLSLLICCLTLASCKKSEEPETTSLSDRPDDVLLEPETLGKLVTQKSTLERDLGKLISSADFPESEQMRDAMQRLSESYLRYQKLKAEHPALTAMNQRAEDLRQQSETLRDYPEQMKAFQAQIASVNGQLADLYQNTPEIKAAEEEIAAAEKNLITVRRDLAEKMPEAKHLAEALADIDGRLRAHFDRERERSAAAMKAAEQ